MIHLDAIMMICASTLLTDMSGLGFNQEDRDILYKNRKACERKFKDKPCLTEFIKLGTRRYHINCGVTQRQN